MNNYTIWNKPITAIKKIIQIILPTASLLMGCNLLMQGIMFSSFSIAEHHDNPTLAVVYDLQANLIIAVALIYFLLSIVFFTIFSRLNQNCEKAVQHDT